MRSGFGIFAFAVSQTQHSFLASLNRTHIFELSPTANNLSGALILPAWLISFAKAIDDLLPVGSHLGILPVVLIHLRQFFHRDFYIRSITHCCSSFFQPSDKVMSRVSAAHYGLSERILHAQECADSPPNRAQTHPLRMLLSTDSIPQIPIYPDRLSNSSIYI